MLRSVAIFVFFFVLGFLTFLGIGAGVRLYNVHNATKQAQAYMDVKAKKAGVTVEVSQCTNLPVKGNEEPNWACLVTVKSGGESVSEVLQFTPNNLAGKDEPADDEETPQFDHSKDTNI